jgi:hypothetical protein
MNKQRIILDIVIAISVLYGWWFVILPVGLYCVWKFPGYIEILIAGIAYDSLFGFTREVGILGYMGTIVAALVILFVFTLKKVMR